MFLCCKTLLVGVGAILHACIGASMWTKKWVHYKVFETKKWNRLCGTKISIIRSIDTSLIYCASKISLSLIVSTKYIATISSNECFSKEKD